MHRITIALDDDLMATIDRFMAVRGYQNRSEAIRDLTRSGIEQEGDAVDQASDCVAAVI